MGSAVFDTAEAFAEQHAATAEQASLTRLAFQCVRDRLVERKSPFDTLDCVRIPRLVHAAVTGRDGPDLSLTVALTLLYIGIDLWDSAMDHELDPVWQTYRPVEVSLAAAALIAGIAPLALAEVDAPAAILLRLQQSLARSFAVIAAAQQRDIALVGADDVSSETALAVAAGKGGEVVGLFAETAAVLAGAAPAAVTAYAGVGRAIGTATQLRSDLYDLFGRSESRDLVNGTRTVPITLYLDGLDAEQRRAFLHLLDRARTSAAARQTVCETLQRGRAVAGCALVIEQICAQGHASLQDTGAFKPACNALRLLVDSPSLIKERCVSVR